MPPKRKTPASETTTTRTEDDKNGKDVSPAPTAPTKRSRRGSDDSSAKISTTGSPAKTQETKQPPKRRRGRPAKAKPKKKNNGETASGRLKESSEQMDYEASPESSSEVEKQKLKSEQMETEHNKSEDQQTEEHAEKSEEMEKQRKRNSTESKKQPQDTLEALQNQEKPAELAAAEQTVPVSSGEIKEHKKHEKNKGGKTAKVKNETESSEKAKEDEREVKYEDTDNKKSLSNEQKKIDLKHDMPPNVLEKGHISFFYRPKISSAHPSNPNQVQRLYIMLIPTLIRPTLADKPIETFAQKMEEGKTFDEKEEGKLIGKPRLLIMAKKKLPEIEKHARYWTFVEKSFENLDDIKSALGMEHYSTKTRGERTLQPCRPLGRGAYSISEHNSHTHLSYVLELPSQPGEVQSAFNIKHEASYIVTVKNPTLGNPPGAGLPSSKKSSYPPELMEKFEGLRFAPLHTTEFLDYENCELVLIGTDEDIKGELGAPGEYLESWADEETKEVQLLKDRAIFEELHLEPKDFPHESLKGIWE